MNDDGHHMGGIVVDQTANSNVAAGDVSGGMLILKQHQLNINKQQKSLPENMESLYQ